MCLPGRLPGVHMWLLGMVGRLGLTGSGIGGRIRAGAETLNCIVLLLILAAIKQFEKDMRA